MGSDGLFITTLFSWPLLFFSVVFTVVVSIIVHELSHGLAAIRLGDRTPIESGHMTIDPLVHLGPFSIIALALAGIAWGSMPIDPTRIKGRYGESIVAAAGPASNLVMALIALSILGIWFRAEVGPQLSVETRVVQPRGLDDEPVEIDAGHGELLAWIAPAMNEGAAPAERPFRRNLRFFLFVFGTTNLALCLFNLLPIPPLDGSHILANFHHGYRRFLSEPGNQVLLIILFAFAFSVGSLLFKLSHEWSMRLMEWIVTVG